MRRRGFSSSRVTAGIIRNTPAMLIKIPLDSSSPISKPMVKLINSRESSPAAVVMALEKMRMKHWRRASSMAFSAPIPLSRQAFQACSSMMA